MDVPANAKPANAGSAPRRDMPLFILILSLAAASCASRESVQARSVAAPRLQCPEGEAEIALGRQTPEVREWLVACDFAYVRIHCSKGTCTPAPARPRCVGELWCFDEDPVTLKWVLNDDVPRR